MNKLFPGLLEIARAREEAPHRIHTQANIRTRTTRLPTQGFGYDKKVTKGWRRGKIY